MKEKPLVSILAACYNHEKFIDDFVQSVLEQTYDNIELIICDDCSKDNSYGLLLSYWEELENKLAHVEILKNEANQGVTKNFNRLLRAAKGEIIKIVASDDFFAPEAVSRAVSFFEANEEARALITNGNAVKESSSVSSKETLGKMYETEPDFNPETLLKRIFDCNIIAAPCAFLRKNVFDEFGLYDESFAIEDLEYWLRLVSNGVRFFFLDEELIYYRKNENSLTSMEANTALERRRIFLHGEEMGILKKYRSFLPPSEFAKIVINRNINEYYFAAGHGFAKLQKAVKEYLDSFGGWKDTDVAFRTKARFRILKCR